MLKALNGAGHQEGAAGRRQRHPRAGGAPGRFDFGKLSKLARDIKHCVQDITNSF
jgi:hypothetical protein